MPTEIEIIKEDIRQLKHKQANLQDRLNVLSSITKIYIKAQIEADKIYTEVKDWLLT